MGMFDRVEGAKPKVDAAYFKPGQYLMRIDRVKVGETRKKRAFVAIELTNLKTIQSEPGVAAHASGESVSQLFFPDNDYFEPEFKAFAMAAFNCKAEEVTKDVCESIVDPTAQPLAGALIEVHAKNRVTKENKDFTNVAFKRGVSFRAIQAKDRAAGGFLDDAEIARFFPSGSLAVKVAEEKDIEAKAAKG